MKFYAKGFDARHKFFDNLLLSTEYDLDTVTKVGEC